MEPIISKDGQYLFFNNSNEPPDKTDLFYAKKINDSSFQFMGEVKGVNSPMLDAVASMDSGNHFYFVSLREYELTYSSIYSGIFQDGSVSEVHPVAGNVSQLKRGWINMDAEISADGKALYFVNALFNGGSMPASADISVAYNSDGKFVVANNADLIFKNINTKDLEYAPSISSDGFELFFTRFSKRETKLRILRAKRKNISEPFGEPEVISAIQGFVEAPSITSDGKTLYFHKKDGAKFSIYKVIRAE